MKNFKILLVLSAVLGLSACEVNTSSNIDFEAEDIKFVRHHGTDLCFALSASRKSWDTNATGLGLTTVPCSEKVLSLIE